MLGDYLKKRRKELNMTRNALSVSSGISHTEISRIESGERKHPSIKIINSLAEALSIPSEELLKEAGYVSDDSPDLIERAFPSIKTEKQKETLTKIVDGISRNNELDDSDLDNLYNQIEMFIMYAKNKKNS